MSECACGCGRAGLHYGQKYASKACKQKAYRERKKAESRALSDKVSTWLIKDIGADNACFAFEQLNKLRGEKYINAVDRAIAAIIAGYRIKMTGSAQDVR